MPLFKKKTREEIPAERLELPELPPFSEMQQIKEAIKPIPEIQPLQQAAFPPIASIARRDEGIAREMPSRILTQEISEPVAVERIERVEYERGPSKVKEPIFVKIDKFKDALANFELVKEKLAEIDSLLKKIKETRTQEQQELDSWEKEIEEIKAKIEGIDEKLFSKIE